MSKNIKLKVSNEVSILGYDALGLIYYCWANNNFKFHG